MRDLRFRRLVGLLLLVSVECFGQNGAGIYHFWNQELLSGEVGVKGRYRYQQRILGSGFEEIINGTLFSGRFLLKSKSFIVNPNLMEIDFEGEFNPEKLNDQYSSIPDRSDARTLSRLNLRTTFFREKKLTVNAFVNMGQSYVNRENFTNSRMSRRFFGGGIYYKNRVLPASVTYEEGKWDQEEVETNQVYKYWQRSIKAKVSKTFFTQDDNRLSYSFDDYIHAEYYLPEPRENKIHNIELNSSIPFDRMRRYNLLTFISNFYQTGYDNFNRFQVMSSMTFRLPKNFRLVSSYNFYQYTNPIYQLNQHRGRVDLNHQLFKSLKTNIYAEYTSNKHTIYSEDDLRTAFEIRYTKKIPKGNLNLSYSFLDRYFDRVSEPVPFFVTNEEHVLSDDQITLLDQPYADIGSVVVKDVTGTVIYDLDLDYLLFEQNNYIEIKRIPGGKIPDNATVLVDYTAMLPGSYKFNMISQSATASLTFFDQFIEVYYRWAKQDYSFVESSDLLVLNYFYQNLYGIKFKVGFARFGIEYDDYESTIIPYQLIRLNGNMLWRFKQKLLISLVGNLRYYITIADRRDETYGDVSARIAYSFTRNIKLNLELSYREQNGYEIGLNYLIAKTELNMVVRKLYITLGLEVYRRNYLNREILNFNGAYVTVIRKFKSR
ncbi:MAG: hypothetical protein GXO86_07690 [Chlorobi bacterium]|nr:hypothetical protein [Chlorobiota bacterium]